MTHKLAILSMMLGAAVLTSTAAYAHHSNAMFVGNDQAIEATGTVVSWEWVNPHTWLTVEITGEDGTTQNIEMEGWNPARLLGVGITRDTFKPGDTVTIKYRPAKDGSPMGMFGSEVKVVTEEEATQ